jgi:predicted PurR-regulated permease PerM
MDGVTGEAMGGERAVTPDPARPPEQASAAATAVAAGDSAGYAPGTAGGYHRDRLLATMTLILGLGLLIALPFALREGADFFLPLTAALVAAVALVPPLEWLERRGLPSGFSAFLCLLMFLGIANVAIASVVVPASNWVALLPDRLGRIRTTVRPLVEVYASLNGFINKLANTITVSKGHARTVTIETPDSLLSLLTSSAPFVFLQFLFGILLIFFFLAGWSSMRRRSITRRASFNSAMTLARVIQDVVDATSSYIATITLINLGLGCVVATAVGLIGLPTPLMWGGLVTLLNYVPYLGPIAGVMLLGLGGLMTFADPWTASVPALIFVGLHLIEANIVTPTIVGRRLTINPLLILVAISFWGWVWGTIGAVLAVPLLVITRTVLDAAGRPDIAGFLFEYGTLASGTRRTED